MSFKKSLRSVVRDYWKLGLLVAVILLGFFWWYQTQQAADQNAPEFINPTRGDIRQTITISGTVDAKEKARLRFIAGGKVTYLNAQEGDMVQKGQTIASIDRATLEKQLQQDLNLYMTERWNWEERLDDTQDRTLDTTELREKDQAQWRLDNQVINVEIRDIAIRNSYISAPFSGILTVSPTATTGVQLLASDYFEIVNPDSLIFAARIDEADVGLLALGQPAEIVLDAFLDKTFTGTIEYISYTSSQQATGTTFTVHIPLHDLSERELFRLGMNGDATILLAEKSNVLTIPITAIKQREGKTTVEVKTGETTTESREITIGLETDDEIEVLSGLSESDLILLPE